MAVLKSLTNLLDKNKVKYKAVKHKTTYTALDSAETQKLDPKLIVKTLILKLDKNYCIVNIPANKNIDLVKFKKVANSFIKKENKNCESKKDEKKLIKKISFATEAWMKKNIKGNVGVTPCFGSMFKLATYLDNSIVKLKKIYINSGDYEFSLEVSPSVFQKIEPGFLKGSFAKSKPKKAKKKKKK